MSKFLKRYSAHKGEVVNVSHDFTPYAIKHSTTLSAASVQNIDRGISISNEAVESDLWSAQVTCSSVGNATYELVGTYADGSKQVMEFVMQVYDGTVSRAEAYQ